MVGTDVPMPLTQPDQISGELRYKEVHNKYLSELPNVSHVSHRCARVEETFLCCTCLYIFFFWRTDKMEISLLQAKRI